MEPATQTSKNAWLRASLLALAIAVVVGGVGLGRSVGRATGGNVGCGGVEAMSTTARPIRSAITNYYPTLALPSSGKWQFSLRKGTYGTGVGLDSAELSTSGSINWANLANNNFDNVAESFALCNHTGAAQSFAITVYKDANYTDTLQNHGSQKIPDQGCTVVNMKIADVASSVKVSLN